MGVPGERLSVVRTSTPQSAISARIRHLEDQVGAPLFTRDRNDIRLTAVGKRLLPHAESIVTAWHRARQEVTLGADMEQSLSVVSSQPAGQH